MDNTNPNSFGKIVLDLKHPFFLFFPGVLFHINVMLGRVIYLVIRRTASVVIMFHFNPKMGI